MRLRRDIERKLTLGHMRVNRQHAPCHAISSGREPWQRDPQQRGIGTVDLGIALVNALVAPVQNLHGAKFALEPFAEPQFELRSGSWTVLPAPGNAWSRKACAAASGTKTSADASANSIRNDRAIPVADDRRAMAMGNRSSRSSIARSSPL